MAGSEQRFRELIETINEVVYEVDASGVVSYINPAIERMLGYSPAEVVGQTIGEFIHEEDRPRATQSFQNVMSGQAVTNDYRLWTKTGEVVWARTSSYPVLEDGRATVVRGVLTDITERIRAVERSKQQQYYLEKAQELGQIGTWELDLRLNELHWTDEICRIFGVPPGSVVNYGIFLKKVHPDDREYVEREWNASLAGKPYDIHHRVLVGGTTKWVREKADIEFNEEGAPISAIGFAQDITERKQAENELSALNATLERRVVERTSELRKSEANLRNLINSTDDLFCIRDMDGGVVTWNKAWGDTVRAHLGVDAYMGMNTMDLLKPRIPDFTEHHQQLMKRAYAGEVVQEEFSFELPDGEADFFEITYTPVWEGERVIGVGEYNRRITERKLEQERLRQAEEKYRTIAEFTYDWEYWEAPDGQLLYVSPSCERISGYGAQEFIKDPRLLTELVLDADRSEWDRHVTAEGFDEASIQFRMTTKDGQIRWIEHMCTQVVGEDGAPLGLRGSNRDITDRKAVEDALRREQESRAAAWREASTQRGLLAHAQRISTVEGLASSLAHDLSQPLAAILSNAQAARRFLHASEPDTDEVKAILDDIIAADKRAGELIWRLRSFVRREPTEHVPLDVNAVIKSVVEILNSDMVIKGVALRTELSEKLPMVMGDQIQLQQVLVNLITNAEHAVIDLPDSRRAIVVRSNEAITNAVVIEIRDRGPGFDKTEGDIFEPFFTTKSDGMGMGLSICRSLVESHGGQIWAEDAADGGARVCFTLPAPAADQEGEMS